MTRIIYTFTIEREDGETSTHDFFDYAAGWGFTRQEQADYHDACDEWLDVEVKWEETVVDREYTIKPSGEIIWED